VAAGVKQSGLSKYARQDAVQPRYMREFAMKWLAGGMQPGGATVHQSDATGFVEKPQML
jgi:hypothetical protein